MEIKYIKPFIDATLNVFKSIYDLNPEVQKPYMQKKGEDHQWDISGVIGIAGEAKGVVVVSFHEALAKFLAEKIMGSEVESLDEDIADAVGEVVNIISGNAKKGLEDFHLMISLPSVIKGTNHKVSWPERNLPIIVIPFKIDNQTFSLSVGLENIIK